MIGGVGIQHPISCMYQTVGSDLEVLPTVNGKLLTAGEPRIGSAWCFGASNYSKLVNIALLCLYTVHQSSSTYGAVAQNLCIEVFGGIVLKRLGFCRPRVTREMCRISHRIPHSQEMRAAMSRLQGSKNWQHQKPTQTKLFLFQIATRGPSTRPLVKEASST